jgi:hypothetical protein
MQARAARATIGWAQRLWDENLIKNRCSDPERKLSV